MRWMWMTATMMVVVGCGEAEPQTNAWGPSATDLGWTMPTGQGELLPPPITTLSVDGALVAGAPATLELTGAPAGTQVIFLASMTGVGGGPCHPAFPAVCTALQAPMVLGNATVDVTGVASLTLPVPAGLSGPVALQAFVDAGVAQEVSNVVGDAITDFVVAWAFDVVDVEVRWGESGYDFGMAETLAGPYGWYGEDCFLGTPPWVYCHSVDASGVRTLQSVHGDVGGPGIDFVVPDSTTLFYDVHDPALTYYFRGWDSGECWAFGDDPGYYVAAYGCTAL